MKFLKTITFILSLLFALIACKDNATSTQNTTKVTNPTLYKIENVQLNKIPDSSYVFTKNDKNSIHFVKSSSDTPTTISIKTFDGQVFGDDDAFMRFAESYITEQMKPYKMKSLHYDMVGFKNTMCLKFDGTYQDTIAKEKNREYVSQDGYLCILPDNPSKLAEMKVVHYSSEREMPKNIIYQYQSFIEQLTFTKDLF